MSVRLKSPDASTEGQPPTKRARMTRSDPAAAGDDLDEDLHSRQLAVYGRESMRKMAAAQVLILGLNGLGVEIGGFTFGLHAVRSLVSQQMMNETPPTSLVRHECLRGSGARQAP